MYINIMTQENFKNILNKRGIYYKKYNKWLIITNKNINFVLFSENITKLPDYLIFNNKGYINLESNKLTEFPKNIIFNKNINDIYIENNIYLKFKSYGNYFSKMYLNIDNLDTNLIFEKLISLYIKSLSMPVIYQTPHICLTKVLQNNENKEFINIKLPKNFLSLSSWI